jgi:hypothetical protein
MEVILRLGWADLEGGELGEGIGLGFAVIA